MLTVFISGYHYLDVLEYGRAGPIDCCCVPSNIEATDPVEIIFPRLVRRHAKLHQATIQIVFGAIRQVFRLQGWIFDQSSPNLRATFQLVPDWNLGPKGFSNGYKYLPFT